MKLIILFILFLICSPSSFGQFVFNKTYQSNFANSNNFTRANYVMSTSDSNFLVVGAGKSLSKMSAIKLNKFGDTTWSYVADFFAGAGDILISSFECYDGNYIVGGFSGDPILLQSHADLIKLNKNTGDTIWVRKIGLPDRSERCYSVKETPDHGFIFSGLRYNLDSLGQTTDCDIYLVKTDSLGIPQWEQTYGGSNLDWSASMQIADDGGFMLFGTTYSYGIGTYNMYLVKTDSIGNFLWQKTYGGSLNDYGTSICKLNDGNYALAGLTYLSTDSTAAFILKIDPDGNEIWQKKMKGIKKRQEFTGVKQLVTGEIVACGDSQGDYLNNTYYGILYKLDETDGTIIWQKQYDYFQEDSTQHYFYGMDICLDEGMVMTGMVVDLRSGASPTNYFWVVKTNCQGNDSISGIVEDCNAFIGLNELEENNMLFNLYPNPSTGAVTVDYFIPQNTQNQSISFYDATGKLVQKVDFTGEGQIQLNVDCSGFSNGVYTCILKGDNKIIRTRKLVIIT
jgi:hypothetical protein